MRHTPELPASFEHGKKCAGAPSVPQSWRMGRRKLHAAHIASQKRYCTYLDNSRAGEPGLRRPNQEIIFKRGEAGNALGAIGSTTALLQLLCSGDVRLLPNPFQQKLFLP